MPAQIGNAFYDRQFGAALVAGLICWIGLWWWSRPLVDFSWPLHEPLRFAMLALVYPVLEEVIFRGGLQSFLLRCARGQFHWHGVTLANVVTSVVFAMLHFFMHTPLWAIVTFVPSLVFGYFRDRHASIATPITLHVYYNAGYFLMFST